VVSTLPHQPKPAAPPRPHFAGRVRRQVHPEREEGGGQRGAATGIPAGRRHVQFSFPVAHFKAVPYSLTIYLVDNRGTVAFVEKLPLPNIVDQGEDPFIEARRWGVMRLPLQWSDINSIE